jgi:hypothetical protein
MNETLPTVKIASKDILARLLASEDIAVEHSAKAATASFNTKSRVLVLPIWKDMDNNLYDMLVGHEVAHALFTPAEEWAPQVDRFGAINRGPWMTFVNIVEDARIERKIKDKFPGLRRDFYNAYADLAERDIFEISDKDISELPLIDRLNLEFKIGPHVSIPFNASERKWTTALETTKSFADVVDVAADLFQQWLDDQPEQTEQPEQSEQPESMSTPGAGDGEESDNDESGEGQTYAGDDETADDGDSAGGADNGDSADDCGVSMTDDTDDGESAESTTGEGTTTAPASDEDNTDYTNNETCREVGATQNAMDRAVQSMVDGEAYDREYHNIPSCNLKNTIVDYKDVHSDISTWIRTQSNWESFYSSASNEMKTFQNESRKTINMMAQQFIRRQSADEAHRTSIAKTGILNMTNLHSYQWNEDVFLRNEEISDGKNHGLVLFVDWSGSMSDIMSDTIKQTLQMVFFCKKVGIPFEVYSFTSAMRGIGGNSYWNCTDEEREEMAKNKQFGDEANWLHQFQLNNYLSSRMSARELKTALIHMQWICNGMSWNNGFRSPVGHDLGSTPLNEAVVAAFDIVPKFQRDNKLQIVNTIFLTDGESSSSLGYYSGRSNAWLRDTKTKKSYDCSRSGNQGGTTGALLSALNDRTGAKTVGLYLHNARSLRYGYTDNQVAQYKKEGFTSTTKAGYTEYFIVKASKKVENDYLENLNDNASFTQVKNAFMKSSSNRVNSRVLLNRVIDLIAT